MSDTNQSFADTFTDDEPLLAPEPDADAQPEAQEEQPHIEPEPQPEPAPSPTPEPQPAPVTVPINVLHAERDRRIAAEARSRELQGNTPPPAIPDPYEDPQGFARYQAEQTHLTTLNLKLDLSEDNARERHGDELVDKARDWMLARFATNPALQAEVFGHRNPYGYAVTLYQQQQLLEEFKDPTEIAAYRAWKAAQTAGQPQPQTPAAAPAASPTPAPRLPPRSLASAPGSGDVSTQVFDEEEGTIFSKKG